MTRARLRFGYGMAVLLAACGASTTTWMREANQLAAAPLDCNAASIATRQSQGFTYDSIGCDRAVRHICRDQTCTVSGDVTVASAPGYLEFSQRVTYANLKMDDHAANIARDCGNGRSVAATLLIAPDGEIEEITASMNAGRCVRGHLGLIYPGSKHILIHHVFRAASDSGSSTPP